MLRLFFNLYGKLGPSGDKPVDWPISVDELNLYKLLVPI